MFIKKKLRLGVNFNAIAKLKPLAAKFIYALPAIGLVTLILGTVLLSWQITVKGASEGKLSYQSGRYAIAHIASGNIKGNLLPPPSSVPASLMPEDGRDISSTELVIPDIALPEGEVKLRPAPNMALIENEDGRQLPKQSADGVKPWEYYSRPFTPVPNTKPISVIVTGIGMSNDVSLAASKLPPAISFSVPVYVEKPDVWVRSMRIQGHECYLDLPLELSNYPLSDPGPKALQPSIMPDENMKRLNWLLGQAIGYVGFIIPADEVYFAAQKDFIEPVATELADRGLAVIFSQAKERPTLKEILKEKELVHLESHIFVRYGADAIDIRQQLEAAEALAKQSGHALIVIEASPVAIQELEKWTERLHSRGYQLMPASALARKQFS